MNVTYHETNIQLVKSKVEGHKKQVCYSSGLGLYMIALFDAELLIKIRRLGTK